MLSNEAGLGLRAKTSVSLTVGLLLMTGCGGSDNDSSAVPPRSNVDVDEIDTDELDEFGEDVAIKSCIDSVVETGASDEAAEEYCNCAIERIIEEIGIDGLNEFGMSLISDEEVPEDKMDLMEDIIIECSSIVLDEFE